MGGRITAISGRIDADGAWGHLRNGDDIGKFGRRKPLMMDNRLGLYERQHAVTATETK